MLASVYRIRFLLACAVLFSVSLDMGCKKSRHERKFDEPFISADIQMTAREDSTLTTVELGVVIAIGGFGEEVIATAEVIRIETDNTTTALPSLSEGRARHVAVAIKGGTKVAIAGGFSGSLSQPSNLSSTLIYDVATGTIQAGPNLPEALSEQKANFWNGGTPQDFSDDVVFLIGGRDASGDPSDLVLRWNLALGTITNVATLDTPRADHTATLSRNASGDPRIYVIGGVSASDSLGSTEVIDPSSGIVTSGPDLPAPRSRHAAVSVGTDEAILIVGGLDSGGLPIDQGFLLQTTVSPETVSEAGRFGPAAFDLLALPLGDGNAVVLGGFSAMEDGTPVRPLKETALFAFDSTSGEGQFIDLPDFDLSSGAGAPAGAVRPGNDLDTEGTGTSVVLAGGRGSRGELRRGRLYNPYNPEAALTHDLTSQVGPEKALVGATLIGIFGVIERIREYDEDHRRNIDLKRVEDPVLGTVVRGEIGEWDVHLEIDGGMIYGEAAEEGFVVFTESDDLRADGIDIDLKARPDATIDGRYYLSWKKNSLLVQVWKIKRAFEGRIASDDPNVAIKVEDNGTRTDEGISFFDNRTLDLDRSR